MFARENFLGICPGCGTPLALHTGGGNKILDKATTIRFIGVEVCKSQIEKLKEIKQTLLENPTDLAVRIDKLIMCFEESMGEEMALVEDTHLMKERHKV